MQKQVMSLVGFSSASEIAAYKAAFPHMHYELSYKMSEQLLSEVKPMLAGRIASVHACCPSLPIFPNFGSHDEHVIAESYDAICKSFETARSCNADIVVLHPGYVCDWAMPSSNAARKKLLDDPSFSQYIVHPDGAICGADYPNQDIYRYHAIQAFKELGHVAQVAKSYGVKLAVENLNPVSVPFPNPMGNGAACCPPGRVSVPGCRPSMDFKLCLRISVSACNTENS
jgi:sugar phosphate isomerase/epimerase